ncbi:hypothetical protein [Leucobacter japonicus]|uniref:hypothetical protein n=1 Tax=Leucobacter japonicus TaxID=1461259 RepID=UPI0006A7597C|nr:hypothetical protein [Leucobacter japonicus]
MLNQEQIDVYALTHTSNVVRAVVSDDPESRLRNAYLVLASQKLTDADTARVVEATLGNVLGIIAHIIPDGAARTLLTSRLEAVSSYADLLSTVNNISGPTNRAARRKKGNRK